MRNFDFVDLRLFVSVCRTGSIARTAAHEHLAPSAVSKRLTHLEERAGTALLHRDRNNIRPTEFGKVILDEAEVIFAAAQRITERIDRPGNFSGALIRVLTCSTSISWKLVDAVSELLGHAAFAKIQIEMFEVASSEIVRRILDDSADIGICRDDVDLSNLSSQFLGTDTLSVIVPRHHRLAGGSSCTLEDISGERQVALAGPSASKALVSRVASARDLRIDYRMLVPTIDTALKAVKVGLGIAVLPGELVRPYADHFGLTVVALAEPWAARMYYACTKPSVNESTSALKALLARTVQLSAGGLEVGLAASPHRSPTP